jgi:hypothetical protein
LAGDYDIEAASASNAARHEIGEDDSSVEALHSVGVAEG